MLRRLLDPRPADEAGAAPLADAVNIPLHELPQRTHELPTREHIIPVAADAALAGATIASLASLGRTAVVVTQCSHAPRCSAEVGRLWRPAEFLEQIAPLLRIGRALDVACGSGRDTVYLASLGWDATGVDLLDDALARARDLSRRCAAAIRPPTWQLCDVEQPWPDAQLGGPFDLVTAFRFLHRPLVARLIEAVAPGGSLIYETFTTLHLERNEHPRRREFLLEPGELPTLVAPLQIRAYDEAWRTSGAHTARLWATRADPTIRP
jgi:SAM-dependent methyltransferase